MMKANRKIQNGEELRQNLIYFIYFPPNCTVPTLGKKYNFRKGVGRI